MLDRLLGLLNGHDKPSATGSMEEQKLAVAALLVEAARMDEDFDENERASIAGLLTEHFDLGTSEAASLINQADVKVQETAQYHPFTNALNQQLQPSQKVEIIEMLWRVAYADGTLDPHEDQLIRQIAGLIHVTDRERMLARKRALGEGN
ncbi:MAG: TerB family tellurite resistance protein [Alphaproteobacteria bacterium]|nr:TerB family tellurite resistance protein [Alphaproteobacteria bacterium]